MSLPTFQLVQFRDCMGIAPDCRFRRKVSSSLIVQPLIVISDGRPYTNPISYEYFDTDFILVERVSFTEFAHILSDAVDPSNPCNEFKGIQHVNEKIMIHVLDLIKESISQVSSYDALRLVDSLPDMGLKIAIGWFNDAISAIRADIVDAILKNIHKNRSARIIQQHFRSVVTNPSHPICQRRLMHEFANMTC